MDEDGQLSEQVGQLPANGMGTTLSSKRNQPNKLLLIVLGIIILLSVVGLYYLKTKHVSNTSSGNVLSMPKKIVTSTPNPTRNWQMYTNERVSFKYPQNWYISTSSSQVIFSNKTIKGYNVNLQGIVGYFNKSWNKQAQEQFGLENFFSSKPGYTKQTSDGAIGIKEKNFVVNGFNGVKILITDNFQKKFSVVYAIKNGLNVSDFEFDTNEKIMLTQNDSLLDTIVSTFSTK